MPVRNCNLQHDGHFGTPDRPSGCGVSPELFSRVQCWVRTRWVSRAACSPVRRARLPGGRPLPQPPRASLPVLGQASAVGVLWSRPAHRRPPTSLPALKGDVLLPIYNLRKSRSCNVHISSQPPRHLCLTLSKGQRVLGRTRMTPLGRSSQTFSVERTQTAARNSGHLHP